MYDVSRSLRNTNTFYVKITNFNYGKYTPISLMCRPTNNTDIFNLSLTKLSLKLLLFF